MKSCCLIVLIISTIVFSAKAQANTDQELLNEKLFQSVTEGNFKKFQEYLAAGADPNWLTDGETYYSSAFCEVTKRGNEQYLEAMAQMLDNIVLVHGKGIHNSPAACAVRYGNITAYRLLVDMGIDVLAVLDPDVPVVAQRTLLDLAINRRRADIVLDILQQTELNERQIISLTWSLEHFGGFEGDKTRSDRILLTQWLHQRGIEVNLAPASPPRSQPIQR